MNPLSGLYGAVAGLRNTLFDRGWIRSRRLQKPVVSVGNLSAGGAGKTPFVIALGKLLKERGVRFDVLSRGYGRRSRGVLVVDPYGQAAEFGDEPLLIARRLGVPVIVGQSRYAAGLVAEQKFQSQLHVLDDGFQHRALVRDFDIVLVSEQDFRDRSIPVGRLREPISALQRADAVVLPESDTSLDSRTTSDVGAAVKRIVWRMRREIAIPDTVVARVVFCGIARPQQFFAQVRAAGIVPAAEVEFRDHHSYDLRDIKRLVALRGKTGADGFLTTEKDAINLEALNLEFREKLKPLAVVELKLTIHDPEKVVETILARLDNRKGRS